MRLLNAINAVSAIYLSVSAVAAPPSANALQWGEPVNGLQMAVSAEPHTGFIYCWLRNASTNEITYNRCFLGSWEAVGIEYHDGTDWRRLARTPVGFRFREGLGPTARQLERLPTLQVITNCPHGLCWADARYGPAITVTNDGRIGQARELRTDLPRPSSLGATFTVDIGDFEWPASLLSADGEIRLYQHLLGPGHDAPITVRSLPMRLESQTVRDFLKRLRRDKI